ncbi:hypothetical protein H2200_008883 [Cladophialophora chaetospira]|uniref:Uncharacterized protein n=1 Tax=Cladophialophora chaetospira TaxID=386627 RepID=A0AA38X4X7_9EURO|nr:hypothetical protein H2200_008883 [Cladophialophora chaetospira]
MPPFQKLVESAEESPRESQQTTPAAQRSSSNTETAIAENEPRAPQRAYTKVPYRSPTAPRAEPLSSTVDKASAPILTSTNPVPPQERPTSTGNTEARLRGGWDETDWFVCFVCSCLLCDDCCYESTGSTWRDG